mmetsp:Transcript_3602/g.10248  ORF Transcript_3602/g.10248 Transcript_3602/m.10248 type:complete len:352 (+) Transcript_3602:60-1115(+)
MAKEAVTTVQCAASKCDVVVCCVGLLHRVAPGLVEQVVNKAAFMPPWPPGYHVTEEQQVYLIEADYGLMPMPDLSPEGVAVEPVRMTTRRGNSIPGFHFRHGGASRRTLIFSHGNGTDIGIMFRRLKELAVKLEIDAFAYEYSGYGESSGSPSEEDLYADIEAAYEYLTDTCGVPAASIICYGQSIGSVPSIDLATKHEVGGVIVHSGLTSGFGVLLDVREAYAYDVFQNLKKIRQVSAPVFIIHGTHDIEVPFEHGAALFEACRPGVAYEPWWVQGGGHNDIDVCFRAHYFERLADFLKALDEERESPGCQDGDSSGEVYEIKAAHHRGRGDDILDTSTDMLLPKRSRAS